MARDRQRAKQRRRRQGGPAPRGGRSSAALATSGSTTRRRGRRPGRLEEHTPSELKHSSADVDEALLAEARRDPARRRRDGDARRGRRRATSSSTTTSSARPTTLPRTSWSRTPPPRQARHPDGPRARPARKPRGRILTFLRHCVDELRRVQWPDRRQVGQGTAVVLGFVVIAGGLPRPAGRDLEAASSTPSSSSQLKESMFRWYVINTYSGHENKVKQNLEHRVSSLEPAARRAPGRRPDRDRPGDEGQPEDLGREAHHARLRAREHGPQRGLVAGRQGHARASPASSARPTSRSR